MKKFLTMIIALFIAVVCNAGDVPVINSDFSLVNEFNAPEGWSGIGFWDTFESGDIDGNKVAVGTENVKAYQDIPEYQVKGGYRYTLSFDAAQTNGSNMMIRVLLLVSDPVGGGLSYVNDGALDDFYPEDVSDGLKNYSFAVNALSELEGQLFQIRLYIYADEGATETDIVYIDNLKLEEELPTPGDINYDGSVNLEDFAMIASNWLSCNIVPDEVCEIDGYVLAD